MSQESKSLVYSYKENVSIFKILSNNAAKKAVYGVTDQGSPTD